MQVDFTTQIVLLLSTPFHSNEKNEKFLNVEQITKLKNWLDEQGKTWEDLLLNNSEYTHNSDILLKYFTLQKGANTLLNLGYTDNNLTISYLLSRGFSLAFAVEKWIRCGVTMCNCFEDSFKHFKSKGITGNSPIVFYYGDLDIITAYDSFVLESTDLYNYLVKLDKLQYNRVLYDEIEISPKVIGKTDKLIQVGTTKLYRQQIVLGNLLLVSTNNPS